MSQHSFWLCLNFELRFPGKSSFDINPKGLLILNFYFILLLATFVTETFDFKREKKSWGWKKSAEGKSQPCMMQRFPLPGMLEKRGTHTKHHKKDHFLSPTGTPAPRTGVIWMSKIFITFLLRGSPLSLSWGSRNCILSIFLLGANESGSGVSPFRCSQANLHNPHSENPLPERTMGWPENLPSCIIHGELDERTGLCFGAQVVGTGR